MNQWLCTATRTIAISALGVTLAACGTSSGGSSTNASRQDKGAASNLKLAPQFGLSYLPDVVMSNTGKGYLSKELPDTKITRVQLSSGGAVVEQIIAGAVNVGYMGVGPFLKGVDSGAKVKAVACLEEQPLDLMVMNPTIKSIDDLTSKDRIALPGPSSHQAYTLEVAANNAFKDPKKFDTSMVGLPHPDAMKALLNRQGVTADFTQEPYTSDEEAKGAHSILNSYDVFGRGCLIVAVAKDDMSGATVKGIQAGLSKAVNYINTDPSGAADLLAKAGDQTPHSQLVSEIGSKQITWTTTISGLQKTADLMYDAKLLKSRYDANKLVFPDTKVN